MAGEVLEVLTSLLQESTLTKSVLSNAGGLTAPGPREIAHQSNGINGLKEPGKGCLIRNVSGTFYVGK
jgi:hypothetical protein